MQTHRQHQNVRTWQRQKDRISEQMNPQWTDDDPRRVKIVAGSDDARRRRGVATLFLPSAKLLAAPLLPRPEKRKLSSASPFRVPTRAHLQPAGDQVGNRTLQDRQNQTNQPNQQHTCCYCSGLRKQYHEIIQEWMDYLFTHYGLFEIRLL
jgi:hypothetical protein